MKAAAVLLATFLIALSLGYLYWHRVAENRRIKRLEARPDLSDDDFIGALRRSISPDTGERVRIAIARSLDINPLKVRPDDKFRIDYELPWNELLDDAFDARLDQNLRDTIGISYAECVQGRNVPSTVEELISQAQDTLCRQNAVVDGK